MSTVLLATVKDDLRKSSGITVDDAKLQRMIDAAEAEYTEWIGPLTGTVVEVFDGGGTVLVLRQPVNTITAAAYDSGATLTYTDLTVSNGIVRWGSGTAGRFTAGTRVSITYTAPTPPAHHLEVIAADVAGFFEATQRSTGAGQAAFPGDGAYDAVYNATPAVLFPRIRALAATYPSVA